MVSGGRPSAEAMRAPMRSSGTMMRRIGRRCSESSPVIVARKGWAARIPASMRIVLPELPASSTPRGRDAARAGRGRRRVIRRPPRRARSARWRRRAPRRQLSVDAQSRAGGVAVDRGRAVGHRGEQRVAMRDGLVARRAHAAAHAGGRLHQHRVATRTWPNYNRWLSRRSIIEVPVVCVLDDSWAAPLAPHRAGQGRSVRGGAPRCRGPQLALEGLL